MYGFGWIRKSINWAFGLLGYQPKIDVEFANLLFAYSDRLFDIDALVKSLGHLEKERRELNDVITTLLTLQGQEEFVLQEQAIQKVCEQGLETELIPNFENKTLVLKVQVNPTINELLNNAN